MGEPDGGPSEDGSDEHEDCGDDAYPFDTSDNDVKPSDAAVDIVGELRSDLSESSSCSLRALLPAGPRFSGRLRLTAPVTRDSMAATTTSKSPLVAADPTAPLMEKRTSADSPSLAPPR